MSKKQTEELKRLFGQHTWQTTDDLVISIMADVGRLESQLRNIDPTTWQYNGKVTRSASALKVWHWQFLELRRGC